jgi:hypothetical protein
VTADFVALLLAELEERKLRYQVVASQAGYDAEAPGLFPSGFLDIRLTQREVILARTRGGLQVANPQGQYAARLTVPTAGGPVALAELLGDEPGDRLTTGLWPSDHAGVVVTLKLSALQRPPDGASTGS